MFVNSELLGGGVRVTVQIREETSKGDQRDYLAFDGKLGHHSIPYDTSSLRHILLLSYVGNVVLSTC